METTRGFKGREASLRVCSAKRVCTFQRESGPILLFLYPCLRLCPIKQTQPILASGCNTAPVLLGCCFPISHELTYQPSQTALDKEDFNGIFCKSVLKTNEEFAKNVFLSSCGYKSNPLISFLYSLIPAEVSSACAGDGQSSSKCGCLHTFQHKALLASHCPSQHKLQPISGPPLKWR